jgi:hypothetical protein
LKILVGFWRMSNAFSSSKTYETCWSNWKRKLCCVGRHRLTKQPARINKFLPLSEIPPLVWHWKRLHFHQCKRTTQDNGERILKTIHSQAFYL